MNMELRRVGVIRSELDSRDAAPKQGNQGAPDAVLELDAQYADAAREIEEGSPLVLITWLHLADRSVLRCHPRGDESRPKRGIFATRSPDRPNPIGLHPVTVKKRLSPVRFVVGPMEALDGTPVIDVKPPL